MAQWSKGQVRLAARKHNEIPRMLMGWRKAIPSRHHYILNPKHEFGYLLRQFLRRGYVVIEESRSKEKGARWHEPVGTVHIKSKIERVAVIKKRYVKATDAYERGTSLSVRSGMKPITVYRRKKNGADLEIMREILGERTPFGT